MNDLLSPLDSKTLAYDSMNRLVTSQSAGVGRTISYSLDGVGNRLAVTGGDNAGTYVMIPAVPPADFQVNQYTTTLPFDARTYDANGNLVSVGAQQQFIYDYRNQLVTATFSVPRCFRWNRNTGWLGCGDDA
jgi:hypothetical protein